MRGRKHHTHLRQFVYDELTWDVRGRCKESGTFAEIIQPDTRNLLPAWQLYDSTLSSHVAHACKQILHPTIIHFFTNY